MISRKDALEARLAFWEEYHQQIEDLGYRLGKDAMVWGGPEVHFWTSITPKYDEIMAERFREILGRRFNYKGNEYKISISPSVSILRNS